MYVLGPFSLSSVGQRSTSEQSYYSAECSASKERLEGNKIVDVEEQRPLPDLARNPSSEVAAGRVRSVYMPVRFLV